MSTLLTRLRGSQRLKLNNGLPRIMKSASNHTSNGLNNTYKMNRLFFSIQLQTTRNSIKIIQNKNSIYKLFSRSIKNIKDPHHRTHNTGLSEFWLNLGFNANPWKVLGCGLVGGFCGALCGVGGGIVMIPLLRNITTMTVHQIAGTSLVAVCTGALVSSATYRYSSNVTRVPIALNIALASMVFSYFGAHLNARISSLVLSRITGISLLSCIPLIYYKYDSSIAAPGHDKVSNSELIRKHMEEDKFFDTNPLEWYKQNYNFCAIGCCAGFLSGLIGIGGGIVMTSLMIATTNLSQHEAVATSLLCIAPTSLIGSLVHYKHKHIVVPIAILLAISCSIGMFSSSHLALEISDGNLKLIFCLLLAASSARMLMM